MRRIELADSPVSVRVGLGVGLCALTLALGCATHLPVIRTHATPEPVSKGEVVAAAVQVLQQRGYSMALVNENVGVLATEWADDTSVGTKMISVIADERTNHRKQVAVSVSPDAMELTVTVSRQEQTENSAWSNREPSDGQREEADAILGEILAYAAPTQ